MGFDDREMRDLTYLEGDESLLSGQLLAGRRPGAHFYTRHLVKKPVRRRAGDLALAGPGGSRAGGAGGRG
jgi:hypothetical protein